MADGSFRRVFHDEEHHREEYLDRQLEVGWEDDPADRALEPEHRAAAESLAEAGEEATRPRLWRRYRAPSAGRAGAGRAVSTMRRSRSGS